MTMPTSNPSRNTLSGSTRLLRAFWPEIRKQRWSLFTSFGTVLLTAALQVLEPWPLKFIYDLIFHSQRGSSLSVLSLNLSAPAILALSALSMVALTGLAAMTEYFGTVWLNRAACRMIADIRNRLFAHLIQLPASFFQGHRSGDLITRVTFDIDRMRDILVTALLPLMTTLVSLSAMITVMLWMDWRLGLVAIVTFPLFALSVSRRTSRIKEVTRVQRSREGAVASTTSEVIGAIRVVQAFSLQPVFFRKFSLVNRQSLEDGAKAQALSAGLERTTEVLVAASTALVLWAGAQLVLSNKLTPGELIVFVTYLRTAFKPIRQLAKYLGQIAKAVASGDRVLNVMHTESTIKDRAGAIGASALNGSVQFDRVSFEYEPGTPVLRDLCFFVPTGERIAVVGASGSGKSTLASLLLRFHDATEGRILIDGRDSRDYTLESLRSHIAFVPQDSVLFAATVRDNIAFGSIGASETRVMEAAHLANVHEFAKNLPQRYETVISERGTSLSGGQRQRIAIARAALRQSAIVILDEPTTGLDDRNAQQVMDALDRITKGRTTFLITHDLRAARGADVIVFLQNGRILERGSHAQLMALDGRYAEMYRGQMASRAGLREQYATLA
jgi:ATP-binding cassette, subfamily B, bacterial